MSALAPAPTCEWVRCEDSDVHHPTTATCATPRDAISAPVFEVGQTITRRSRADFSGPPLTGTITAVKFYEAKNGYPAVWGYMTSWGSGYPAYELVAGDSK